MNKHPRSRWLAALSAILGSASLVLAQPSLHQTEQAWPIQLGASGGNINDISSLYCCSGTLGALVKDAAGNLHILSNNHVLGRGNQAQPGEEVNHPGMIDQNCEPDGAVADVSKVIPLKFGKGPKAPQNTVDAAMALIRPGAVDPNGSILEIGPVSSATIPAAQALGKAVQKSGRTTGLTKGTISAVNVSVKVGYSSTCGGAANNVALFVNQLQISSSTFSAGGDSGSVIFEDAATPRAVGLLFAGSSSSTLANPIDSVLSALGVTMVAGTTGGSTGGSTGGTTGGGAASEVSVQCITYRTQAGRNADRDLVVTIAAVDNNGQPVPNATVAITLTLNGANYGAGSAATDATGSVTFSARNAPSGNYSTAVTISKPGLAFVGGTPPNVFRKGIDSVPAEFGDCAADATSANAEQAESSIERVRKIKEKHSDDLLATDNVVGHGIGLGANGQPVIEIYLKNDNAAARARIPAQVENVPVRVVVTGEFMAY